jgi:hypothetical protein
MADASGYEQDAPRIDREYIPDNAKTDADIRQALENEGFPDDAIDDISGWLMTEDDAWNAVGGEVQDAGSVERALRRDDGAISETRARSIANDVADEIQSARRDALDRVGSDGAIYRSDGAKLGNRENVEEQVRDDGFYYENTRTGSEIKVRGWDR